jgi:hypothetical protein
MRRPKNAKTIPATTKLMETMLNQFRKRCWVIEAPLQITGRACWDAASAVGTPVTRRLQIKSSLAPFLRLSSFRYRDLQQVERHFRNLKTQGLEVRPVYLRKANRTRAHVCIAMLALKLTRVFEQKLQAVFGTTDRAPHTLTLDDALLALSRIIYLHYDLNGRTVIRLPRLDKLQSAILETLGIRFPANTASSV